MEIFTIIFVTSITGGDATKMITKEKIINEIVRFLDYIDSFYTMFNEIRHKILTREITVEEFDNIFNLLNSVVLELNTIKFAVDILE